MRIVYIHQYFNTPEMAGGTRSYEMARRLAQWGHQVNLVTSWRKSTNRRGWVTTLEDGIRVHWVPVTYSNTYGYAARIRAFLRFAVLAAFKAASLPADVVFATSTPLTIAFPGVYAARRHKVPFVFEVRDLWPELPIAMGALRNPATRFLAEALERFAYRNATRIITLSPGMADGVARVGYPTGNITTIPNAADVDLFRPDERKARSFREKHPELGNSPFVLYAGTLGKINGVDYLVDLAAAMHAKRPSCHFVIIGHGMERDHVVSLAKERGVLSKNVFVYNPMPKQDLVEAFSAASLVASLFIDLPAMEANSANKFFDGLASGTPLLINYGGWQEALLTEANAGVRLSRDVEEASRQLQRLIADNRWLREAGTRALALARQRFSRDNLARELEAVLLDAAEA